MCELLTREHISKVAPVPAWHTRQVKYKENVSHIGLYWEWSPSSLETHWSDTTNTNQHGATVKYHFIKFRNKYENTWQLEPNNYRDMVTLKVNNTEKGVMAIYMD